jgi:hypothetical protein
MEAKPRLAVPLPAPLSLVVAIGFPLFIVDTTSILKKTMPYTRFVPAAADCRD